MEGSFALCAGCSRPARQNGGNTREMERAAAATRVTLEGLVCTIFSVALEVAVSLLTDACQVWTMAEACFVPYYLWYRRTPSLLGKVAVVLDGMVAAAWMAAGHIGSEAAGHPARHPGSSAAGGS